MTFDDGSSVSVWLSCLHFGYNLLLLPILEYKLWIFPNDIWWLEKEQNNAEEYENDEYIDTDFEETYGYETVYEKDELVGAIDEWMLRISDTSRVPWSDKDAMDSFPVLRSSIKLDPFHQFDWSQGGRSHTGRLV